MEAWIIMQELLMMMALLQQKEEQQNLKHTTQLKILEGTITLMEY